MVHESMKMGLVMCGWDSNIMEQRLIDICEFETSLVYIVILDRLGRAIK